jgi:hypothetical protein
MRRETSGKHAQRSAEAARLGPRLAALAATVLAAACAQAPLPAAPDGQTLSAEQRLQNLEWRVDALERFITNVPGIPQRSRAEIEANIRSLEQRRVELLQRYLPPHPAIREIDLSLKLLRWQLQMLDQGGAPAQ